MTNTEIQRADTTYLQRKRKRIRFAACAAVVILALVLWMSMQLPGIRKDVREESRAAIRDAVIRSAVECYTVEGAYPATLRYLEDHYGLVINHDDFIVSYEVFASNVMPDIRVLVHGEG